jgi:hypothetical protein
VRSFVNGSRSATASGYEASNVVTASANGEVAGGSHAIHTENRFRSGILCGILVLENIHGDTAEALPPVDVEQEESVRLALLYPA